MINVIDVVITGLILASGVLGLWAGVRLALPLALSLSFGTVVFNYSRFAAAFSGESAETLFIFVLVTTAALLIFGLLMRLFRAVDDAGMIVSRLLGVCLGVVTGVLISGGATWTLGTYGTPKSRFLIEQSTLASSTTRVFQIVMEYTSKSVPLPESKQRQNPFR